jgi:hypothetical protein
MIDDDGCRAGSTNRLAHQGHTSVPDKPLQARRRAVHARRFSPPLGAVIAPGAIWRIGGRGVNLFWPKRRPLLRVT